MFVKRLITLTEYKSQNHSIIIWKRPTDVNYFTLFFFTGEKTEMPTKGRGLFKFTVGRLPKFKASHSSVSEPTASNTQLLTRALTQLFSQNIFMVEL